MIIHIGIHFRAAPHGENEEYSRIERTRTRCGADKLLYNLKFLRYNDDNSHRHSLQGAEPPPALPWGYC